MGAKGVVENKHTLQDLQEMQALPLNLKISLTKTRIRAWVNEFGEDGVYVSFSGGKDSAVLLHLVRELDPNIPAVFVNTGLEFPEIVRYVQTYENVEFIRPKMNFKQVCKKYGYPIISKEVAECVYGARRYLERVLTEYESQATISQTDRQTDTRIGLINYADAESTKNIGGGGTRTSTGSAVESDNIHARMAETYRNSSSLLTETLTKDYGKAIDNYRVQRMMNILPTARKSKATTENIPSDRSMFSCERYQFFLDAPFEICNQCCTVMKKKPAAGYSKRTGRLPITGEMASDSRLRTQIWLKQGCNGFDSKKPKSMPMAFWTEQDCLMYVRLHGEEMLSARKKAYEDAHPELSSAELESIYSSGEWGAICSVYGDIVKEQEVEGQMDWEDYGLFELDRPVLKTTGVERTGCMFCLFGIHMEKEPNRLQKIKHTHPKIYNWMMKPESEGGLGYKEKIDWINEHGDMHIKYE